MSLDPKVFAELGRGVGQAVDLRQVARGTYDAQTDAFTGDTTATTPVRAIIQTRTRRYENGQLVTIEDLRAFIVGDGLGVEPEEGDVLIDGADEYRILTSKVVKAAGLVVGYSCTLEQ